MLLSASAKADIQRIGKLHAYVESVQANAVVNLGAPFVEASACGSQVQTHQVRTVRYSLGETPVCLRNAVENEAIAL